jgi:hypothetical protein
VNLSAANSNAGRVSGKDARIACTLSNKPKIKSGIHPHVVILAPQNRPIEVAWILMTSVKNLIQIE